MSLTDRISHFFNGYDDETEYDNYDNGSSQVRTESEGPQGNQKNRIMSIVGKSDHSQKKIMLFGRRRTNITWNGNHKPINELK